MSGDGAFSTRRRTGEGFLTSPSEVVEYSLTTVVPPDYSCEVDRWLNLILRSR